jgi:polyisoprenoid-binding protein YceI
MQEFTGTFIADPVHSSFLFAVQHMKVSSLRATLGDFEARLEGGESGFASCARRSAGPTRS